MKKTIALVVMLVLTTTLTLGALAEGPTVVEMFYKTNRPMNDLTELTHQYVIDNLGIDMQLIQGSDDWKQQLALFITSSDIPDLISFMDLNSFIAYAEEGVFYDLTDLIANYPNILDYVGGMEMLKRTSIDGRIYGIPSVTPARSYYVTNIRTDWLERLGLSIPKTLEEYTDVMRAFVNDDPDGDGKKNTYGFGGYGYEYLTPFFGAFGATPQQAYFLNEDGTITTNVISADYKAALNYLHDIYVEGLIDPELFTSDYNQTQEKWVRGEMGIWTSWWSGAGNSVARFGFMEANPEGKLNVIQPPVGADGKSGVIGQDPVESVMAISYDCNNVEKVLELIDWACTNYGHKVLLYGIEGQFFENDENGNLIWNVEMDGKDRLGNEATDMQVYRFFYNIPVENEARALSDTPAQKLYLESVGVYSTCATYPNLFMGLTSEAFVQYNSELTSYIKEWGIKFILGEASLEADWDNYVKTYLNMGGDEVRQSLLKEYNEQNATAHTFKE